MNSFVGNGVPVSMGEDICVFIYFPNYITISVAVISLFSLSFRISMLMTS
jgi:hypothetical protein